MAHRGGWFRRLSVAWLVVGLIACAACQPAKDPSSLRSPHAQKWFDRARNSFQQMDVEDAQDAIGQALRLAPQDPEIRLLAANLAIAKLDYAEVLRLTEGVSDSKALAIRGRAQWYLGDIQATSATLEALLRDPDTHDPWAKAISKLANHGTGRKPYRMEGDIVASVEMPRVRGTAMVVPVEIDGEQALALLSTGTAEVVLDKTQRAEPSWISVRIDGRVEFQDVPAVTQDLSGVSRQLGAPIKAMFGVNFLRNANVTFDFQGRQFVVRQFSPPRPPRATDIPVHYIRGGGMMVRSALASDGSASLYVDSSQMFPLALDTDGWRKAGVDPKTLTPFEGDPKLRHGIVPLVRLGAFDIPQVAAVLSNEIEGLEQVLGLNVDGVVGSGLLGGFRVTLGDSGKVLWVEEDLVTESGLNPAPSPKPADDDTANPPVAPGP
ncbi:MAG: hypothetical protein BWY17_03898 [Deltaproteobacteria bacterium ADurb.Bin207]|nr:MAG: hypothetical protein BWY17_03898 [Deltaproteobacteria bacterium ADurb.Bin207]